MSWCHAGTEGKGTLQPTNRGDREGRPIPEPSWGCCDVHTGLRSLWKPDPGECRATNLCRQPKYCRPHAACCLGPPCRVWGNSRLHRSLCWLLSKNEEVRHYHSPWPTPGAAGQKELFSPKSFRYGVTSGHRTQQMLLVSGKSFTGFYIHLVGKETSLILKNIL